MTYQIENENDLIKALKECRDGDTIRFWPQTVITGFHIIDKSITIDGTCTIKTRDFVGAEKHRAAFTITKSANIVGDYYGDMVKNPTDYKSDGLQTCFRADGASYVDLFRTNISGFNYMGVHLFDCTISNFHGCDISDCATPKEKYGFGYGIWQGGKGNAYNQVLNVNGCTFSDNRHCIAGSKHPNHIYVSDCDFHGGEFSQHLLDRHGDNQYGGGNYFIIGNRFHAKDRFAYDLAKPDYFEDRHDLPVEINQIRIEGNTFARPFGMNGRIGSVMESEEIANYKNNLYA